MSSPALATSAWWSIADANPVALAIVVIAVALAAIGYVGSRLWATRAGKRRR